MSDGKFSKSQLLAATPMFGGMPVRQIGALAGELQERVLRRGEVLVRVGDPADNLYVVLTGRFTVHVEGSAEPVAEISQGELVGEVGFFAGLPRTATVRAARDSTVLELDRAGFARAAESHPGMRDIIIAFLARRFAELRLARPKPGRIAPVRTLAVLPAGGSQIPIRFIELVRKVFGAHGSAVFLTREDVISRHPGLPLEDQRVAAWLNQLEADADLVVYIADGAEPSSWTHVCIRQADALLLTATAGSSTDLNPAEQVALSVHPPTARRLIIVQGARRTAVNGTAAWLDVRDVLTRHHVVLQDAADVERLYRFIAGKALGFVAGGGGALGSAHIGVYKALVEAGCRFDFLGGTSAGAAMMAAFACGVDAERVDLGTHNIFIREGAFRRPTLPRYGLLNHKAFDRALRLEYGDVLIEDLWQSYFAVSSNLSDDKPYIHRRGLLWQAVRASSSIPGILPPFFTTQGEMLVDGAVMDNLPLSVMRNIKTGPNVVVTFALSGSQRYHVDYDAIPGPVELAKIMLNPFARKELPAAPSILQVLMLSMLAQVPADIALEESDVLISPALPTGIGVMDWSHHTELFLAVYQETKAWIEEALKANHPGLKAVLAATR
jgi:NTE family protein